MFFSLYLKLKPFRWKKCLLFSDKLCFHPLFLFAFFENKNVFFASFLNNFLFFSPNKPLFFLHLFSLLVSLLKFVFAFDFFLKKKKTSVFRLPFSLPFFSLISSFFFFEHRSFLVPFFLPSGYKCS